MGPAAPPHTGRTRWHISGRAGAFSVKGLVDSRMRARAVKHAVTSRSEIVIRAMHIAGTQNRYCFNSGEVDPRGAGQLRCLIGKVWPDTILVSVTISRAGIPVMCHVIGERYIHEAGSHIQRPNR